MRDLFGDPLPVNRDSARGFTHEPAVGEAEKVDWYTPPWIFEALGLEFELDPCAPPGGLPWIPAKRFYWLPTDGLDAPWPDGPVWCNPPYGKDTGRWLARMASHGNGVALVFARTDTDWFHAHALRAERLLFLKGRVPFVDKSGKPPTKLNPKTGKMESSGPGAGSMLLAWGDECTAALARMSAEGWLATGAERR